MASPANKFRVYGTIRDNLQRPLAGAEVRAFDKDIRNEQPLGKPVRTDKNGNYALNYARDQFAHTDKTAADIIVRVYGANKKLLKESDTYFNAPPELQVDLDLSGQAYSGPSEFEATLAAIKPFIGKLPLSQLTDDAVHQDITFLMNKAELPRATVEALAMAFRFEKNTKIEAPVYYGLVRQGPASHPLVAPASNAPAGDFATRSAQTFGSLMRQSIDALMAGIQNALDANTTPYTISAQLPAVRRQLIVQQQRYLKQAGGSTAPAELTMKLSIAGLQGEQVSSFVDLFSKLGGENPALFDALAKNPQFQTQKTDLLQAVFSLSQLTGEQIVLTDALIKTQKISKPEDLGAFAAHSNQDWLAILSDNKIDPPAGIAGQDSAARAELCRRARTDLHQGLSERGFRRAHSERSRQPHSQCQRRRELLAN